MTREIKFRGKRKDTGEWMYGDYCDCRKLDNTVQIRYWISKPENYYASVDCDPATVGQYTGLKDKNGVEIYKADIVLATYGKWHEEPKGLTRACKVVWDVKTCSFRMAVNNSKVLVSFGDSRGKDIEVIGNIHDNPELLQEVTK